MTKDIFHVLETYYGKQTNFLPRARKRGSFGNLSVGFSDFWWDQLLTRKLLAGFLNYQRYHDMKFQQKKHHKSLRGVMKAAPAPKKGNLHSSKTTPMFGDVCNSLINFSGSQRFHLSKVCVFWSHKISLVFVGEIHIHLRDLSFADLSF